MSACRRILAPGCESLAVRLRAGVSGVVVHRIEVSQEDAAFGDTPEEVARFFREHPIGRAATGGPMPYPILVDADGVVTQTVPLCRVTPHAKLHNPSTVGVAAIGDFRARPPSAAQRRALVSVCAALVRDFALTPAAVHGHDELQGASADPTKECPGRHLSLTELRADVAAALEHPDDLELLW